MTEIQTQHDLTEEPSAVALADLPEPDWTGPRCEKCTWPLGTEQINICRHCGYYASLNTFVEVDPWEVEDTTTEGVPPATASHLEVWLHLIPLWGWKLIITALSVLIGSIAVRLWTTADEGMRTYWSVRQLLVGLGAALTCHLATFLMVIAREPDMGVADVVVRPLKAWMRVARNLPDRLWILNTANAGLCATFGAVVIIGGIPYHYLLDWNIRQRPKPNLLGAVLAQAQQGEGDMDELADSINALADDSGTPSATGGKTPPAVVPRKSAECLIIGYTTKEEKQIHHLLVATLKGSNLVYAGRLTPSLTPDEDAALLKRLQQAASAAPFVKTHMQAKWVRPRFTCRVSYVERAPSGALLEMEWDQLLGEINLSR